MHRQLTKHKIVKEKKAVLCIYNQCFQNSVEILVAPAYLSLNSMCRHIECLCCDRGGLVNELIVIMLLTFIQ